MPKFWLLTTWYSNLSARVVQHQTVSVSKFLLGNLYFAKNVQSTLRVQIFNSYFTLFFRIVYVFRQRTPTDGSRIELDIPFLAHFRIVSFLLRYFRLTVLEVACKEQLSVRFRNKKSCYTPKRPVVVFKARQPTSTDFFGSVRVFDSVCSDDLSGLHSSFLYYVSESSSPFLLGMVWDFKLA